MFKAFDLWLFNDNSRDWSNDLFSLYGKLKADAKSKQKENDAKRVLDTKPSLALEDYTGKYASDIYGEAEIKLQEGSLFIKYPNNNVLKLAHWNYDIFKGGFNNSWWDKSNVQFFLNSEGRVSYFEMDGMRYNKKVEANK
jgi:hypothetical protein